MHNYIKCLVSVLLAGAALCSCGTAKKAASAADVKFPELNQDGKIAIVAHRGFWNCEAAGYSENTVAALKAAQDNGFWGSEFDIHITSDDVVIVNHNDDIDGKNIWTNTYAELNKHVQPNGENVSTLDDYLKQGKKCKTTKLVIEFKIQKDNARMDLMIDKTVAALKAKKLFSPDRVLFISFSKYACDRIAKEYPQFVNQYLSGGRSPEVLASDRINGLDYHYSNFFKNPEWVKTAHDMGMSVNAWTVNNEKDIKAMIDLGVDAITTNYPLLTRELLGEREFSLGQK